ncbi:MarR family winged helix-turn-helix transcriptional regulator [Kitasatospora mediocidica]|uniref:MarR family winged helix-turn-helix transcriptional regulator n=1 Tax=Kitasatospora mediocidica TaxID=58352 RepID=UPI00055F44B9|nr:MarR family transcriptional regulator [Kitasatospora mediocidica]
MQTTAPAIATTDLMFLLSWTSHSLQTELTAALEEVGISPRAHCVLYKALEGDLTQTQIAEACGLDKTTMVVVVDKLEQDGLAERQPSTTDRRVKTLVVTEKGRQIVARSQEIIGGVHEDVLGSLSPQVRAGFVEGLTRLVEGRLSAFIQCEQPPRRRSGRV